MRHEATVTRAGLPKPESGTSWATNKSPVLRTAHTVPTVLIREERPEDQASVAQVHRRAFGDSGAVVAPLVEDLRLSLAAELGLSLVAVDDDAIVGHVLFTRNLLDAPDRLVDVQVLSPVGVLPERQRSGVGGL
jgi:putative acetyltransferase